MYLISQKNSLLKSVISQKKSCEKRQFHKKKIKNHCSKVYDIWVASYKRISWKKIYIIKFFSGLVEYLSTEISTSKQKKFPLVTFVDTPGLVDGDMNYPFDVNQGNKLTLHHWNNAFIFCAESQLLGSFSRQTCVLKCCWVDILKPKNTKLCGHFQSNLVN